MKNNGTAHGEVRAVIGGRHVVVMVLEGTTGNVLRVEIQDMFFIIVLIEEGKTKQTSQKQKKITVKKQKENPTNLRAKMRKLNLSLLMKFAGSSSCHAVPNNRGQRKCIFSYTSSLQ